MQRWMRQVGIAELCYFVSHGLLSALLLAFGLFLAGRALPRLLPAMTPLEVPPTDLLYSGVVVPLAMVGLAALVGWGNWRSWKKALLRRELLVDELAPLRRAPRSDELLGDDALVGLTQRVAALCRFYRVTNPGFSAFLDDYLWLLARCDELTDAWTSEQTRRLTLAAERGLAEASRAP